jgi:dihydrolipoamide dehydrogenase
MMYDVVIVGGGSGGYAAAIRAAQLKLKVAVIEKDSMGGACLNWGCIPTKTLYRNAELFNLVKDAEQFGINIPQYTLDTSVVQKRKSQVIRRLHDDINRKMAKLQIPLYKGLGRFLDENTLEVTLEDGRKKQVTAKHIIIATGSTPVVPPVEGVTLDGIYTSNEMLLFHEIPKELVIVGAGVVGMEFAGIFQAFGSKVKVISTTDRILARMDEDITNALTREFISKGGEVYGGVRAEKFTYDETTKKHIAWVNDGTKTFGVEGDIILLSIGRKPYTDGLGIDVIDLKTDRGTLVVDEQNRTSVSHIFAIGDVNRKDMLAYTAASQGVRAVELIASGEEQNKHQIYASCIFVFPELAFVGMTEGDCKEKGMPYKVARAHFEVNGMALAQDQNQGFIKVMCDENEKLIGVHILGPNATDLIHEGVLALQHGMSVQHIIDTIHAHPTLAESFREAVLALRDAPLKA